jgi:hypothetical protein
MKKLLLILLLVSTNAFAGITDLKLSTAQIFDVQWYISGGKLNASGFNYIYSSINYATQTTSAARWTAAQTADAASNGRYIGFFNSTTNPGTYGMAVFNSDGTRYKTINNTGSFRTLADGAIFYNGNGMWGTLITTKQGYNYGQSGSFTITQEYPTNTQLQAYTPESTTPLAAGETAAPPPPPAPSYSATITSEQQNKVNAARARQTYKNEVNIDQIGNYNTIDVIQSGFYHLVDVTVAGDSNILDIGQYGIKNYANVQIQGSGNSLNSHQGNTGVGVGHFSEMLISGNNNTIVNNQSGNGEKISFISNNGNGNAISSTQSGSGTKYSDIKSTGNGHTVMLDQKDGGAHGARVEVTNNGGASNVNVLQQGNVNQTYSIQQSCATIGGCSVTVTQQ